MPQLWIPPRGKLEKKAVCSPCCEYETITSMTGPKKFITSRTGALCGFQARIFPSPRNHHSRLHFPPVSPSISGYFLARYPSTAEPPFCQGSAIGCGPSIPPVMMEMRPFSSFFVGRRHSWGILLVRPCHDMWLFYIRSMVKIRTFSPAFSIDGLHIWGLVLALPLEFQRK